MSERLREIPYSSSFWDLCSSTAVAVVCCCSLALQHHHHHHRHRRPRRLLLLVAAFRLGACCKSPSLMATATTTSTTNSTDDGVISEDETIDDATLFVSDAAPPAEPPSLAVARLLAVLEHYLAHRQTAATTRHPRLRDAVARRGRGDRRHHAVAAATTESAMHHHDRALDQSGGYEEDEDLDDDNDDDEHHDIDAADSRGAYLNGDAVGGSRQHSMRSMAAQQQQSARTSTLISSSTDGMHDASDGITSDDHDDHDDDDNEGEHHNDVDDDDDDDDDSYAFPLERTSSSRVPSLVLETLQSLDHFASLFEDNMHVCMHDRAFLNPSLVAALLTLLPIHYPPSLVQQSITLDDAADSTSASSHAPLSHGDTRYHGASTLTDAVTATTSTSTATSSTASNATSSSSTSSSPHDTTKASSSIASRPWKYSSLSHPFHLQGLALRALFPLTRPRTWHLHALVRCPNLCVSLSNRCRSTRLALRAQQAFDLSTARHRPNPRCDARQSAGIARVRHSCTGQSRFGNWFVFRVFVARHFMVAWPNSIEDRL